MLINGAASPRVLVAILALLYGFPLPACSQRAIFGVKVAGQLTGTFKKRFDAFAFKDDRFWFGPMAEIRLPRRLPLAVLALYKRNLNYTQEGFAGGDSFLIHSTSDSAVRSWEIPVL